jgi:hypothetical protein
VGASGRCGTRILVVSGELEGGGRLWSLTDGKDGQQRGGHGSATEKGGGGRCASWTRSLGHGGEKMEVG